MLRFFGIVLLCIGAAIVYGLVHDQITIRISPEYFTVLHPRILPVETPPTVLALAWGVLATWWVGLILGIILAIASCVGSRPPLSARDLVKPVVILLAIMATGATLAGIVGYELASHHQIEPDSYLLQTIPPDHIDGVFTAWFTHQASYGIGFVGGIVVAIRAWIRRGKLALSTASRQTATP